LIVDLLRPSDWWATSTTWFAYYICLFRHLQDYSHAHLQLRATSDISFWKLPTSSNGTPPTLNFNFSIGSSAVYTRPRHNFREHFMGLLPLIGIYNQPGLPPHSLSLDFSARQFQSLTSSVHQHFRFLPTTPTVYST